MLIDTHCHLDFKDFDGDRDQVVERARNAGVGIIINVGSSLEGSRRALAISRKYDNIYATLGIHPHEASGVNDAVINDLKTLAEDKRVVAIGEVGLDYYRNLSSREDQIAAFRKFIHLALETGLPLVIHSRDAGSETLEILKNEAGSKVKGVMHCFSGDARLLNACLDLGLHVSFTCNLTFKNAKSLRGVAGKVPAERLLLETDAPFLAPQVLRGKRNEPAYLTYLADEWCRISGLSAEDITRITTHNAGRLFGLNIREDPAIAYEIRRSLYLNITNRCTNDCDFCIREKTPFVKGHNLKLEAEPTADEIMASIGDPKRYEEIVFCGYGEPTLRLDTIEEVAKRLKVNGPVMIRLVTNGHGDLINSRNTASELKGLIDRVSVSLNADTEEKYERICRPKYGTETYKHVLAFIGNCVACGMRVEITCLDLPDVDVNRCEEISKTIGASFRLRSFGKVG